MYLGRKLRWDRNEWAPTGEGGPGGLWDQDKSEAGFMLCGVYFLVYTKALENSGFLTFFLLFS